MKFFVTYLYYKEIVSELFKSTEKNNCFLKRKEIFLLQ